MRPGYPDEALREAVDLAGLREGDPVLEVGCGTAQATEWLAGRGLTVLAVDRSEEMTRFAAGRLAGYPGVEVRLADFESLPADASYAAVLCATSYHWLDPDDRVGRCASHLRSAGALILLWHTHPRPYTGFFERVQPIYERVFPEWEPPPSPGMGAERIQRIVRELEADGPFERVERRSFDWSRVYARGEYERLLRTYSDHALLPDEQRGRLLEDIGRLIDAEFGGRVERPYRTELIVARRGVPVTRALS